MRRSSTKPAKPTFTSPAPRAANSRARSSIAVASPASPSAAVTSWSVRAAVRISQNTSGRTAPSAPIAGSLASMMSAPPSTAAIASAAVATLTRSCISVVVLQENSAGTKVGSNNCCDRSATDVRSQRLPVIPRSTFIAGAAHVWQFPRVHSRSLEVGDAKHNTCAFRNARVRQRRIERNWPRDRHRCRACWRRRRADVQVERARRP